MLASFDMPMATRQTWKATSHSLLTLDSLDDSSAVFWALTIKIMRHKKETLYDIIIFSIAIAASRGND